MIQPRLELFDQQPRLIRFAEIIAEASGPGVFFTYDYAHSVSHKDEIRDVIEGMDHFTERDVPDLQHLLELVDEDADDDAQMAAVGFERVPDGFGMIPAVFANFRKLVFS